MEHIFLTKEEALKHAEDFVLKFNKKCSVYNIKGEVNETCAYLYWHKGCIFIIIKGYISNAPYSGSNESGPMLMSNLRVSFSGKPLSKIISFVEKNRGQVFKYYQEYFIKFNYILP